MDHLSRLGGRRQIRQHRDLLSVITYEHNSPNQADSTQASLLVKQLVAVPLTFESEPSGLEPVRRIATFSTPPLQVGDKTDAFGLEETEGLSAVAATVENQRERFLAMHAADLGHGGRDSAPQRIVERLGKEEQRPSLGVVYIHIVVPFDRQPALGIPASWCWVLAVVRTEMAVHIVQALPDRLQSQIALEHRPRERYRIDTLGQSLDLGPQAQHRGSIWFADQHAQILPAAVVPVLERAKTQSKTEDDGRYSLCPSEPSCRASRGAQSLKNTPQVQACQGRKQQHRPGITSRAPRTETVRWDRRCFGFGLNCGFQREGRLWRRS